MTYMTDNTGDVNATRWQNIWAAKALTQQSSIRLRCRFYRPMRALAMFRRTTP